MKYFLPAMRGLIIVSLVAIISCTDGSGDSPSSSEQTGSTGDQNAAMAAELREIAETPPPEQTWNSSTVAAEHFRKLMEQSSGQEKIKNRFRYAEQLLNSGQTDRAIVEYTGVINDLKQLGVGMSNDTKRIYELLAISYLRLGEEQNCTGKHNPASCIIPVAPEAVHTLRAGAENAILIYQGILEQFPGDLQSRYLMNLSYMILGDYPDKVPPQFLMENLGKGSGDKSLGVFRDVAIQSNSDILGLSGGICFDDFNNDGLLDIVASSWGLSDPLQYLINEGNGKFRDVSAAAGITGLTSGLNMMHTDYNNDGYLDVLVLRGAWLGRAGNHPNSLLRNNGDNTFTDVTREAGIYSRHPTQAAAWADFNLDGHIDLFIGNESTRNNSSTCELYINNGDGTFREVAALSKVNYQGYFKGVTSGDINNDGWPDVYIASLSGPNVLLLNKRPDQDGIPQFVDISESAGVQLPQHSFPCWFWDFNQDGWEDLFVSSYDVSGFENLAGQFGAELLGMASGAEQSRLYLNNGNLTFTDVTASYGVDKLMSAMGSNFGDINSDGYPDFYIGNGAPDFRMVIPNRMFLNLNGKAFREVTYDAGFGHIQKGHGVAFGDCDNDGDQDIYCVMGGAAEGDVYYNLLFENPGNESNWITLLLQGAKSNRSAIGARAIINGKSADGQTVRRFLKVNTGGSFGASTLRIEAGLGNMQTIESVDIIWPNSERTRETFTDVKVNSVYKITEGTGKAEAITLPTFKFSDPV